MPFESLSSLTPVPNKLASEKASCQHKNVRGRDCNQSDAVNHPKHYTSHPSGVECIDVAEHYGFSVGNAIKYLWRAGLKDDAIQDLEKARWYINREIEKRKKESQSNDNRDPS